MWPMSIMPPDPEVPRPVPLERCEGCAQWAWALFFSPRQVVGPVTHAFILSADAENWVLCERCAFTLHQMRKACGDPK